MLSIDRQAVILVNKIYVHLICEVSVRNSTKNYTLHDRCLFTLECWTPVFIQGQGVFISPAFIRINMVATIMWFIAIVTTITIIINSS